MKKKKKTIKIIKKIKEHFDYKTKYKVLEVILESKDNELIEKDREINRLNDLLDKDLKAQKIERLRLALDHERDIKHKLREEILQLKEKLKEKK